MSRYISMVTSMENYFAQQGIVLDPQNAEMCDMCLSEFCDTLFEEQFGPETGSYLLAGWMALHPEYGSNGSLKIPMLHRTLKGWKRLMPAMSRWPLPWPI
eukprot:11461556-Karenia_brevis.AAC.1